MQFLMDKKRLKNNKVKKKIKIIELLSNKFKKTKVRLNFWPNLILKIYLFFFNNLNSVKDI